MNLINKHLDKNNLHHAYLIEGVREEVVPEILSFLKDLGIDIKGSDFYHITTDSFNVTDARSLKSVGYERSFIAGKKIFIISANSFLLEAQNTLLKIFEEPIEDTHFFVTVPNIDSLLKTLISRFYVIRTKPELEEESKEAEKFLKMSIGNRIDFIKNLISTQNEDENGEESESGLAMFDTARLKALKFLNALEYILHQKLFISRKKSYENVYFFDQIFKVREFINQPGSSSKSLMESLAISIPNF